MPPHISSEIEVSIEPQKYPDGTIAMVRTVSWLTIPVPKISDGILWIIGDSKGKIRQILFKPEYAKQLASVGGAWALLVHRKVQELLRLALVKAYPHQSHPALANENEW